MTWHHLSRLILFGSVVAYGLVDARAGWAQDTRGFVTLLVDRTTAAREGWFPTVSFGATKDLLSARLSVGGQGDVAIWPGVGIAGSLGPIAQLNLAQRTNARTFLVGSYMLGLESGWRAGAGIELLPPARRVGLRASVQRRLTGDSRAWLLEIGIATK